VEWKETDMQNLYDYKTFGILYVDDEEKSLKYFTRAFQDQFTIYTAANAQEGLKILEEHKDEIGVLLTDQRMPGEKGVWLLEKARQVRPRIIRMLATAYSDMDAAVAAVNSGAIYKYVSKPWDPPQLEATLKRALEFFLVQRERDQLLTEKMSVLHNMMIADRIVSLGLLAAGLSHHIRNSLVAVKTFLDLAPSKLKEESLDMTQLRNPDFWKDYYQNVQKQIEKITTMLRDLWVVSEEKKFDFNHQVQLREVLDGVLAGFGAQFAAKNIVVENEVPEILPALMVDRPKFARLFELMLKDEVAHLPPGSRISLSASVPLDAPSEVEVRLRDNGPGLPKEALRLIFDPFAVRSDSPLEYGINLMACYFIIHHHGGRIEANSEEGQGTTFIIRLMQNPNQPQANVDNTEFLQKVMLNGTVWDKMLRAA
jgi:two-component system probable response regulator PhcQ